MHKTRKDFTSSAEGNHAKQALTALADDAKFMTEPTYTANADYPDHKLPFVDKHMRYLESHPSVQIDQYLSNLELMIRKR